MISFPLKGKKGKGLFILKLSNPKSPKIVENELFFMKMARDCGLEVAPTTLVRDKNGQSGLLVERFDRRFTPKSDHSIKVHQEDACQILDRYPRRETQLRKLTEKFNGILLSEFTSRRHG